MKQSKTNTGAFPGCDQNYWPGQQKCYQISEDKNNYSSAKSSCSDQEVWYLNDFGSIGKAELVSFDSNNEVLELMNSLKWFSNSGKISLHCGLNIIGIVNASITRA